MQFAQGKPPETQYATHPGSRAKRERWLWADRDFQPGRIRSWLSVRPAQGQKTERNAQVTEPAQHHGPTQNIAEAEEAPQKPSKQT
jgi:hypothetical protein